MDAYQKWKQERRELFVRATGGNEHLADNLLALIEGRRPPNIVNPEVLDDKWDLRNQRKLADRHRPPVLGRNSLP